ncbi:uncharacterized protein [Dysidea avara]|uniref:uncharacterized protein n=1 Tax=Dysidea avara TaxID=196820 RepID=UPI003328B20C
MTKRKYTIVGLCDAAYYGRLSDVQQHLQNGVDVNGKGWSGWTALHNASQHGHLEVVNTLLSSGANILATTDSGWTALHYASARGYLEVVNTLLSSGANILATNDVSSTVTTKDSTFLSPKLDRVKIELEKLKWGKSCRIGTSAHLWLSEMSMRLT